MEGSPICLDLDSYISQYSGNVCLQRLKFYVDNSRPSSDNYRYLLGTGTGTGTDTGIRYNYRY